jgi:hypothetical protein
VVPIFVSSGRSGLTLLGMIFGSHPDLAVAHEPRFLATMAPKHAEYERAGALDIDRFLSDLYAGSNFRRLGLPREEVRAELMSSSVRTFPDAVRVVFDLYARSREKRLYGDKTPLYITFIEPIADLLPETRFVHLVRDGRDVTLAYLERDKGPASVAEGAFHWRLRVTRGHESGKRLGESRYREFHYEDLIDDPEGTVRRICEFLDLQFHPTMLDYQKTSEQFLAEAKNPGDHQHLTMAPTKGLIDWRTDMTPDDLALFEAIAGDALEQLGYVGAADRTASRLVVWWEWARWQTHRVAWRARWILFWRAPGTGPEG